MSATTTEDQRSNKWGVTLAIGLLLIELTVLGTVFKHLIDFDCIANWGSTVCSTASRALVATYCMIGATALLWMLRPAPLNTLTQAAGERLWPLLVNILGVGVAFVPLGLLGGSQGPVAPIILWAIGLTLILTGIALYVAPLPRWRAFVATEWSTLVPALGVAALAPYLSVYLQPIWSIDWIADKTFDIVVAIFAFTDYDIIAEPARKVIGAGDFFIRIANVCSGIEGIALVTLFVSLYLWLFRKELRFPLALVLYPIGILTSALFNIVRISALLAIGLRGNPELAVGGFHSHAGWMMFTLVALGIIALAQTVPALRKTTAEAPTTARTPLPFLKDPMVARILPFIVFMLSALVASTLSQTPAAVYPIRVVLMLAVVGLMLQYYLSLPWRLDPVALGVGAFIAAYWILIPTTPSDDVAPYGTLTGVLLVAWFVFRGIGTILLVPLIEELFFRGYLEQRLRLGTSTAWVIVSATATALLFAALHGRWAEAFVAGLLFSWVAARRRNITDAIVAHAVANALIFAAAVATQNLSMI
ncbi:exosortase E/protease, VPEID-CTERM system [Octadecabacter sp. CECT 8868]|uniref:exosortase E/protease, VPEID-CTERM system n=1 Tax=Octadecabacter algicola TaxID=2909342 RepID=UPI001F1B8CFB|nr:exosortase E/protease, VPEID-CTERM system [Octadecabacter algicola]MCF2906703.1 exosortase E/protease, VPEID-CTERM system [Octadecabacter algicola]